MEGIWRRTYQKSENENEVQTIDFNKVDKEPSPLLSEVERTIRGLDNIPAELVKASEPTTLKVLHMLCINICDTGIWPHEQKQQELVMIYKNGNNKECRNYQTIALISHTSKILLKIILNRPQKKVSEELLEEQAGFQKD